jgi:TrmH family RNA methyltransferase
MITRNELKYYVSLLQKKYRKSERKFLTEGKKIVLEGVNSNYTCEIIFITEKFLEDENRYILKLKSLGTKIETVKSADFRRISDTKSPEGIAAVFNTRAPHKTFKDIDDSIVVYLEDISDPGNVGTVIRNCDWFGIKNILLSSESAEIYNPKVIRASMGSIFHTNLFEQIALSELSEFRNNGYEFVCSDIKGQSLFRYSKSEKLILFLSNESRGPSSELLSMANKSVTIPGKGKAESLNVASSSAIILAELTR